MRELDTLFVEESEWVDEHEVITLFAMELSRS